MSVTMSRFVRVMSGGTVVTDTLVGVRDAKVATALAALNAQIGRLTAAGLHSDALDSQAATLSADRATANGKPDNAAKSEALETVKLAARAAAAAAAKQVDGFLAAAKAHHDAVSWALAAVDRADAAIKQLGIPALMQPLAVSLAALQDDRARAATETDAARLATATAALRGVETAATKLVKRAADTGSAAAARPAKLVEVDAALSGLLAANGRIVEAAQKNAADTALAALTQRRDGLANAGGDRLVEEMNGASALLADIATAIVTSDQRVEWGKTKALRDTIRKDAEEHAAVGKKNGDPVLEGGGTTLKDDLTNLETLSLADPKAATDQLPKVKSDCDKLKAQFKDVVAESHLLQKVEDLVKADPDCPEAQMKKALGTDLTGKDLFTKRLLTVYKNATFQGSPEINLLSPGEAVAVHTYTTNDYKQMNMYLYGVTPLPPPDPGLRMPTDDQIKIKNQQAIDALAKLPAWTGGMTKRGDGAFPGDDVQYKLGNQFTLKAFWSTDKQKAFSGKWQISVFGKTGKNVAMLSAYQKEDEVLYPPGATFKVTGFDATIPDAIKIVVEEV